MTTTQLNAELFRELNIIVTDDGLMQKAIKALRRITAEKKAEDETNYILSSPAMIEILEKGDEEIKKKGNLKLLRWRTYGISLA